MSDDAARNSSIYTETYRERWTVDLFEADGGFYAKATGPVQWPTATFRTWQRALFEAYVLVDRYERCHELARLNRKPPAWLEAAIDDVADHVKFVGGHLVVPGELVPVGEVRS